MRRGNPWPTAFPSSVRPWCDLTPRNDEWASTAETCAASRSPIFARVNHQSIDTRQLKLRACGLLSRMRRHVDLRRSHDSFRRLSVHAPGASGLSREVEQEAGPATKVRSP
jgi:hypothetical protein